MKEMKLKFVSEGSRGESEITFGGVKELNELVSKYVGSRELLLLDEDGDVEYVNECMSMEFGGIVEDCLVEISFSEEEFVNVYMI